MTNWEGVAPNIENQVIHMDIFILSTKQQSISYEHFLKTLQPTIKITFPETFKRIYWEDENIVQKVRVNCREKLGEKRTCLLFETAGIIASK